MNIGDFAGAQSKACLPGRKGFMAAVVLLLAAGAVQAAVDTAHLAQLYRQGDAQAAYEYAQENLAEGEGDPAFDFFLGVAAIDSGHVNEGVFALERVLLVEPGNQRARLELARGYFLLEEDARARQEFSAVLDTKPPAQVQANIQRFLTAMQLRQGRYEPSSSAFVEYGIGYDDNVGVSPSDAVRIGPILASFGEQEDVYNYLNAGYRYSRPLDAKRSVFAGVDGYKRVNVEQDQFDTGYVSGFAGMNWLWRGDVWRVNVQGQRFNLDHAAFRNFWAVNGEWQHQASKVTRVTGFAQLAMFDYPDRHIRDSKMATAGFGATHLLTHAKPWLARYRPVAYGSGYAGWEQADNQSRASRALAQRAIFGGRAGMRLALTPRLGLDGSLALQRSRYDGRSPLFLKTRRDYLYSARVQVNWLVNRHWSMGAEGNYTRNDSTLGLNDYDRTLLRGFVRYQFD